MSEPSSAITPPELDLIARQVRFRLIEISHRAQTAHLAGALSCVDLLVALYWTRLRIAPGSVNDPARDRLIFSKGHAVSALYTVLAMRNFRGMIEGGNIAAAITLAGAQIAVALLNAAAMVPN